MPKIIGNLKRSILDAGKAALFSKGFRDVTVREIADACHIAVGTLYNYFPSKENLLANVMLEDWLNIVGRLREEVQTVPCPSDGFRAIYEAVESFVQIYSPIWSVRPGESERTEERHLMLVGQLMEPVRYLLDKFDCCQSPDPCRFIAETLLLVSCREGLSFDDVDVFLLKLL